MKSKRLIKTISLALLGVTVITASPIGANAAWKQNNTGWWYTEGSSYATGWRKIDGVWYYFDRNGYMKTGWVYDNGLWYYMQQSGAMKTGWLNDNGTWYFLNPSGDMRTGWIKDSGFWYYLDSSGAMKTGWVYDKNSWYFLKQSGAMAWSEFVEYKGSNYFVGSSGAMVTGWQKIGEDKYYFTDSGAAAVGQYKIGDDLYYFRASSGKLLISDTESGITTDGDGKIIKSSNEDEKLDGFKTIDGKTYYFVNGEKQTGIKYNIDEKGKTNYFYFDKDGVMQKGLINENSDKYYAHEDGTLAYGATKINGKLYWFDDTFKLNTTQGLHTSKEGNKSYVKENGNLATGWKTIDGKKYYFNENGVAVSGLVKIKEDSSPFYFASRSCELQCDASYAGLTTNENGQVVKINNESIKEDILKNASDELKILKDNYGELNIKYKAFGELGEVYGDAHALFPNCNSNGEKLDHRNHMLSFEVIASVDGKEKVVNKYYVSAVDGKIYTPREITSEEDKIFVGKLVEIKNNEIIASYYVNHISTY